MSGYTLDQIQDLKIQDAILQGHRKLIDTKVDKFNDISADLRQQKLSTTSQHYWLYIWTFLATTLFIVTVIALIFPALRSSVHNIISTFLTVCLILVLSMKLGSIPFFIIFMLFVIFYLLFVFT